MVTEEPHKRDPQGSQKAVKHIDTEVPISLWNERMRKDSGVMLTESNGELDQMWECLL